MLLVEFVVRGGGGAHRAQMLFHTSSAARQKVSLLFAHLLNAGAHTHARYTHTHTHTHLLNPFFAVGSAQRWIHIDTHLLWFTVAEVDFGVQIRALTGPKERGQRSSWLLFTSAF